MAQLNDRLHVQRRKGVPPEKSFALAVLKTGVCGYTAYPRAIDFAAFGAIAKEVGAVSRGPLTD